MRGREVKFDDPTAAGAAKTEPEEKVRSPKPGYPARIPAPTRSTCRGIGKSVAGLRNFEERTTTTAPWVGSQSKRIDKTPRHDHA
jgi:hypothetical protein